MANSTLALAGGAAVTVLLVCSAFFSSSETAIFSLPDGWMDERAAAGDKSAVVLQRLRGDPHRLLVTVLVGNNVVNVAIASIVTVVLAEFFSAGVAVTAATVLASFVVLVFGEIVPKSYGLGNAERWSLTVARPLSYAEFAMTPLVVLFDGITRRMNAVIGGDEHIEEPYVD